MNFPKYTLINNSRNTKFSFVSSGPKGDVDMAVLFTPFENGFYNLALGCIISETEIDDLIVVNNGDRNKILATVASATSSFFNSYPHAIIYFSGSTEARTRLYRRAISLNLNELQQTFVVYGVLPDVEFEPEAFAINKKYGAFLIIKKP